MANPDERLISLITDSVTFKNKSMLSYLNSLNIYLNKGLAGIAGLCLLLMVFVVVGNVIAREFYVPFTGTTEVVGWLAAVILAFGLGFTQLQKGYVEIDALTERFPLFLQRIIKSIMLLVSTCFFALVAWKMVFYALNVAHNGNLSQTMKISFYPLIFLVALGFAGLTLALLVDFLNEVMGRAGE